MWEGKTWRCARLGLGGEGVLGVDRGGGAWYRGGMKILVVNVGNSRTGAGWFDGKRVRGARHAEGGGTRVLEGLLEEIGARKGGGLDGVGVSSVVPKANAGVRRALGRVAGRGVPTVWVGAGCDLGMGVDVRAPDKVGADRLADAVAGAELMGTPCIACDFGTATTFNLVLEKRGFCGGAIAPGFGMWFEALGRGTAQLPSLAASGATRAATGRDTGEAMRLGARWGYRGMVTEILWQLSKACGKQEPYLVATGGWAKRVMKDAGLEVPVVEELTLWGVGRIAERNLGRA